MSVVRWIFFDPGTSETYVFAVNPSEGGTQGYKKTFTYQNTSAPDGKTLIFQGRPAVGTLEFKGTIFQQVELDTFVAWWQKQNQITLTDDLGRIFYIVIEEFIPTRVRAVHYPWKHSYTCKATIVNWP